MKNWAIVLSLLFFAYPLSGQGAIFKCLIDGAITYRDTPCAAGQSMQALVDTPVRVSHSNSAAPSFRTQVSEPRSSFQFTDLVVGMTDTKVLNLRDWGRPDKITRTREDRASHEKWNYSSRADGQALLQFENGILTDINTDPAASLLSRRIAQTTLE